MKKENFEASEGDQIDLDNYNISETGFNRLQEKDARWMFSYTHMMLETEAKLKSGIVKEDKNGNVYIFVPKTARPLMNDLGVQETMAIINAAVSKIQALSILDEERILQMCKSLGTDLVLSFYKNMELYGLDPTKASVVRGLVLNLIETNLRKSMNGTALRMLVETERVTEVRTDNGKKSRFWG